MQFIEGAEEAHFYGSVLFGVVQSAPMGLAPCSNRPSRQKNADGVGQLAVGGDIEDELRRRGFGILGEGVALAYEVVFVDVTLRAAVVFIRRTVMATLWNGGCYVVARTRG